MEAIRQYIVYKRWYKKLKRSFLNPRLWLTTGLVCFVYSAICSVSSVNETQKNMLAVNVH